MMSSLALPKSSKSSQSLATREPVSVVRRSYTQELLDMGITFEEPVVRTHHPTNPFLSSASGRDRLPVSLSGSHSTHCLSEISGCLLARCVTGIEE